MKKSINQAEFIIYEQNAKIDTMLKKPEEESEYIKEITELSYNYKHLYKEISINLINRLKREKIISNKVRIFNIIDSLMKSIGKDYILQFSPFIYEMFEQTFIGADMDDKIKLFKLYYLWKYLIDTSILERLRTKLNLDEIKNYMVKTNPKMFERYDIFNENMREKVMLGGEPPHLLSNAPVVNTTVIPQYTNNSTFQGMPPATDQHSRFSNIEKSFLSQIKPIERKVEKGGISDDLFSESSPSNSEFSDNDSSSKGDSNSPINNSNRGMRNNLIPKKEKIPSAKHFKESSDDYEREKNSKQKTEAIKKKSTQERDKKGYSEKLQNSEEKNKSKATGFLNIKRRVSPRKKPLDQVSSVTTHNLNKDTNQSTPSLTNNNSGLFHLITNNLPALKDFINIAKANSNLFQQNLNLISNLQPDVKTAQISTTLANQNILPQSQILSYPSSGISVPHLFSAFVTKSSCALKENMHLFSSISKWFHESIQESSGLKEISIENLQIRTKPDILNIKDFSLKPSYSKLQKKIMDSLFTDLRHICSICGFRTKIYIKFIEHLDIHFHINYLRRSSNNKVLCRKESMNKVNWINNSTINIPGSSASTSYTLRAVLYYQNDSDYIISNSNANKTLENEEDNEQLIFPVQYDYEINCIYCGEYFKKKYFNKYHYWFYINAVNIAKQELKGFSDWDFTKTEMDYLLIHETCIEEFANLWKAKDLTKRNR